MAKKLYIGNLGYDVDQSDLEQLLGQYGQVEEAIVIMDNMSGRSKGFGFVTMADDAAAGTAITELDGKDYAGRALKVNEAKPRNDRGGGGGGGGGGGRGRGGGGGGGGYGGGGGGGKRRY